MAQDEIDIAETSSREAAKFSLDGLKDARSRAHALLLVLLGGGGGLGALGLAQWQAQPVLSSAAMAASVWWFAGAAWVAWRALTSDPVTSWAPCGLLGRHKAWCDYRDELVQEGQLAQADDVDPIRAMRLDAIAAAENARDGYRVASTHAYRALDQVYRAMAFTPVICITGAIAYRWG